MLGAIALQNIPQVDTCPTAPVDMVDEQQDKPLRRDIAHVSLQVLQVQQTVAALEHKVDELKQLLLAVLADTANPCFTPSRHVSLPALPLQQVVQAAAAVHKPDNAIYGRSLSSPPAYYQTSLGAKHPALGHSGILGQRARAHPVPPLLALQPSADNGALLAQIAALQRSPQHIHPQQRPEPPGLVPEPSPTARANGISTPSCGTPAELAEGDGSPPSRPARLSGAYPAAAPKQSPPPARRTTAPAGELGRQAPLDQPERPYGADSALPSNVSTIWLEHTEGRNGRPAILHWIEHFKGSKHGDGWWCSRKRLKDAGGRQTQQAWESRRPFIEYIYHLQSLSTPKLEGLAIAQQLQEEYEATVRRKKALGEKNYSFTAFRRDINARNNAENPIRRVAKERRQLRRASDGAPEDESMSDDDPQPSEEHGGGGMVHVTGTSGGARDAGHASNGDARSGGCAAPVKQGGGGASSGGGLSASGAGASGDGGEGGDGGTGGWTGTSSGRAASNGDAATVPPRKRKSFLYFSQLEGGDPRRPRN